MQEPKAARPYWPDALHELPKSDDGLKPWSWARERLEKSHNYWIATARPDGRPHLMIVWGVWWQDSLWFSTGSRTRKAKNLAAHAQCCVGTETSDQAVILEGTVEPITNRETWKQMCAIYDKKYGGDTLALLDSTGSLVFRVQPPSFSRSTNTPKTSRTPLPAGNSSPPSLNPFHNKAPVPRAHLAQFDISRIIKNCLVS